MKRKDHLSILRKLSIEDSDTFNLVTQVIAWNSSLGDEHDDDREVMLVAFTLLEESLKMLLFQHLGLSLKEYAKSSQLFTPNEGLLGSAYSRLALAVGLSLLTNDCEKDIKDISLIRNAFAHASENITFNHASIRAISDLNCVRSISGTEIFKSGTIEINFSTPRSRVLGFIILFYLFACTITVDKRPRVYWQLFAPSPLPSMSITDDIPQWSNVERTTKLKLSTPL